MVIENALVADAPALSVTRTVKSEVPEDVGVPLIPPAALSVNPAGRLPLVRAQVLPPDPPVAASVSEYGTAIVPSASDVLVMLNPGLTRIESACVATPELSLTRTVKLYVPAVVAVPEMLPEFELRISTGGNDPVYDHVRWPFPSVKSRLWLYCAPTVVAGRELVVIVIAPAGTAIAVSISSVGSRCRAIIGGS
jgi:hypothetical protein